MHAGVSPSCTSEVCQFDTVTTPSAVSGAQQVNKLNWPLAQGVWTWDKCVFLPNSDAPATTYGSSIAVFFHSLNSDCFVGLISNAC